MPTLLVSVVLSSKQLKISQLLCLSGIHWSCYMYFPLLIFRVAFFLFSLSRYVWTYFERLEIKCFSKVRKECNLIAARCNRDKNVWAATCYCLTKLLPLSHLQSKCWAGVCFTTLLKFARFISTLWKRIFNKSFRILDVRGLKCVCFILKS